MGRLKLRLTVCLLTSKMKMGRLKLRLTVCLLTSKMKMGRLKLRLTVYIPVALGNIIISQLEFKTPEMGIGFKYIDVSIKDSETRKQQKLIHKPRKSRPDDRYNGR
jgi:hypothetical protein